METANSNKIEARPPHWKDEGCELYPSCLGTKKYPQCPFRVCMEDIMDSESEDYSKRDMMILRRWFLKEIKGES